MIIKHTRVLYWDGEYPQFGEYLRTPKGTTYLIIGVKLNTRSNPKSLMKLDLLKYNSEEQKDIPNDAIIHGFKWTNGNKK